MQELETPIEDVQQSETVVKRHQPTYGLTNEQNKWSHTMHMKYPSYIAARHQEPHPKPMDFKLAKETHVDLSMR
jgi:hypothetical protein